MGKLKLSVQRKNERRRKYGIYPVRILSETVSNALLLTRKEEASGTAQFCHMMDM